MFHRGWFAFFAIVALMFSTASIVAAEPEVIQKQSATDRLSHVTHQQKLRDLLPLSATEPPKQLANNAEVIVVSGYEPSSGANIEVVIDRPGSDVLLILTSCKRTNWEVKASRSTRIKAIIVSGDEPSVVADISTRGYSTQLPSPDTIDHPDFQEILNKLSSWFGILKIDSFRVTYKIPERVVVSKLATPGPELTVSGPLPQKPKVDLKFDLVDTNYDKARWSLVGPDDEGMRWYSKGEDFILSPREDVRYTIKDDKLEIFHKSEGKREALALPSDFPEMSCPSGIAYDTQRDIIAIVSYGGEGFFYRFDAKKKYWIDFRSLKDIDMFSLAYDQTFDRYVAWTSSGELLFMDNNGKVLFVRAVVDRLPGLGRLIDKGFNQETPRIYVQGNSIALVYVKENTVAGIWHYDVETDSAQFTYKRPPKDSEKDNKNVAYSISRSWFKPSLVINNDPEICTPLLDGYTAYFTSMQQIEDPLQANFDGERKETDSITIITKKLREAKWDNIQVNDIDLVIARTKLKGKPFAIIRRYYSVGWREGFSQDMLITEPLSKYGLNKNNVEDFFEANMFGTLARGKKENIYEVIYKSDPRFEKFDSNVNAELQNLYTTKGSVYVLVKADKPVPDVHLLFKVLNEKTLSLVCGLQTAPTKEQISAQYDKMPALKQLRSDLFDMMGTEGSCGTLHSLSYAQASLKTALDTMSYRPWVNKITFDTSDPDNPDRRKVVDNSLAQWGYSGIWEYHKYKSYLLHLPKATNEIKDFFVSNFTLTEKHASQLANTAISFALIAGFDHGQMEDNAHYLHKRILEGVDAEELRKESISNKETGEYAESLLTFAMERPELLEVLLEKGLDPNEQNAFGKTPLMYATQFNNLGSAKTLLEHGALTELTTVSNGNSCGETIRIKNVSALHYAVRYASKDFIKLLLAHGAPTFIKDSEGYTPYDYLTKFGGFDGYEEIRKHSYGQSNQYLTKADRDELARLLVPPDTTTSISLSLQENLKAERAYREGQLEEAYRSLRRALSLNENNERALSNMSLVALKLGKLGESAKNSTMLIETAKTNADKANAYFNLGLVCQKANVMEYDGAYYCRPDTYAAGGKKKDMSALSNFLVAYKLQPTRERLNMILSFVQELDTTQKKRLCKFPEDIGGVRSLFFGKDLYFLLDSPGDVPFKNIVSRYGSKESPLKVAGKETIHLADGLKLERWTMGGTIMGSLMLDDVICARAFPTAFKSNTRLVEVFSSQSQSSSRPPKEITLRQNISSQVALILYGNNIAWTIEGDLSKTVGIYIHGLSSAKIQDTRSVPVFFDKNSAYPDPMGSSFNQYTRSSTGLLIDSAIDVGEEPTTNLTDQLINRNKYDPKTPRKPKVAPPVKSLLEAAERGDLEAVRSFVADKTDVNQKSPYGDTPLHRASNSNHYEIAVFLVSNGADVNARDLDGDTPLHRASINGFDNIVEFLLSKGADANAMTIAFDWFPLTLASIYGHDRSVQLLLDNGANVNATDRDGVTALHHASFFGRNKVVEVLISNGANVNAMSDKGTTPLYWAMDQSKKETVSLLVAKGADVNARDVNGMTLLHTAVARGNDSIVSEMQALGPDLNARDDRGRPLWILQRRKANNKQSIF